MVITGRQNIAKAINFGKYPVLTMEIGKTVDGYENLYEGCDVRVDWENPKFKGGATKCTLSICLDDGKSIENATIKLTHGGCCLSAGFGYKDLLEMTHWANTPIVKCGQTVVVVFTNSENNWGFVKLMKVADRKDIHCVEVTHLEDI